MPGAGDAPESSILTDSTENAIPKPQPKTPEIENAHRHLAGFPQEHPGLED